MATEAPPRDSAPELARTLAELQHRHRELIEQRLLRRADGLARAREAVRRLGELGSAAGVIARAAAELGESSELDRVVVSRLEGETLTPIAVWSSADNGALGALLERSFPLAYPLVEAELAQSRLAAVVPVAEAGSRALPGLRDALGWDAYVVAPIELEGRTAGLLHGDRGGAAPPLDDTDRELASIYARGLGQAFERAVLRDALERQREELRSAAGWIGAQMLRLADGAAAPVSPDLRPDRAELLELLTRREREVMGLVARGLSNRAIATALVLGEGTVKYHLKNILRKLNARTRTEAVSRFAGMEEPTERR